MLFPFNHKQSAKFIRQQQIEKKSLVEKNPTTTTTKSLLNLDFIRSTLLKEAPWAESHGADHNRVDERAQHCHAALRFGIIRLRHCVRDCG